MIITDKLKKELLALNSEINYILKSNIVTNYRLENFLKQLEKSRYNILSEISLYNKVVDLDAEKVHTIDEEYTATISNDVLKIRVPETLPSYKNLKTHTHKRMMLNIIAIAKQYKGLFQNQVFVYIKVFDKLINWDIDNRTIKPVSDALVLSGVIPDDNIQKMFYCIKGEYSDNPHTEIYVFDSKDINNFLEKYST